MPRILIVEDEAIISEPFEIVLKTKKYKVDTATNGLEALELINKRPYDLILLDIMMPVCDGVEFLKRAQLQKKSPKTGVIVLSNLAMGAEIHEAMALGARKNVLKANITPSLLLEMVSDELAESKKL